jgi:hypothetical protein
VTAIVPAIYTQGKIELLETPVGIRDGKVRIIVMEELEAHSNSTRLQYGKYRSGTLSTETDFSIAEWRNEERWNNADGD